MPVLLIYDEERARFKLIDASRVAPAVFLPMGQTKRAYKAGLAMWADSQPEPWQDAKDFDVILKALREKESQP